MSLHKIIQQISTHFIDCTRKGFLYKTHGQLLSRNIEQHWFLYSAIMPQYNVFLTSAEKISNIARELITDNSINMPFGLATVDESKTIWNQTLLLNECQITSHKVAKVVVFSDMSNSTELFHKKQRERKIWWRKLAHHPSRFIATEIKKSKNCDIVKIIAKFPFGDIVVESITHHSDSKKFLPLSDSTDVSDARIIEQTASLDWGCFALLCDGCNTDGSNNIHIHPKISPYKVGFFVDNSNFIEDSITRDLNQLLLYLNNLLKVKGIHTLLLNNNNKSNNTCLVPFIVHVNEESLKNGVIYVKNQITTISEAVHITNFPNYIYVRC